MADPVWEQSVYGGGTFVRCPYDQIATFIFRNLPEKPRRDIRILEVGCGPGNNLWFLNQEGFSCSGFDAVSMAVDYAEIRCGSAVDLKVAEFPEIPFEGPFDFVVERAALSYVPYDVAKKTIVNIYRILEPGGKFLFTPYAEQRETLGYCCYYTQPMIEGLLEDWKILQLEHVRTYDVVRSTITTAEWRVWAQKPTGSGIGHAGNP
jgi:SAM-dependent methyltransferase